MSGAMLDYHLCMRLLFAHRPILLWHERIIVGEDGDKAFASISYLPQVERRVEPIFKDRFLFLRPAFPIWETYPTSYQPPPPRSFSRRESGQKTEDRLAADTVSNKVGV